MQALATGGALADQPTTAPADVDRLDAARASDGDVSAFERLYRRHAPRITGLVRRMTAGRDVEEMTQDIFVRAWEKLGTFRGDSAFGTWLYRLAINLTLERREAAARYRSRISDDEHALERLSVRAARTDLAIDFETAMERLPDGVREILVLHDVEGYKHIEIAEMLGIATGTSKSQLHRGRMLMRRHLS